MKPIKSKCKCNTRGIVRLYTIKGDLNTLIPDYEWDKSLRNFKFCPLCGHKLMKITK